MPDPTQPKRTSFYARLLPRSCAYWLITGISCTLAVYGFYRDNPSALGVSLAVLGSILTLAGVVLIRFQCSVTHQHQDQLASLHSSLDLNQRALQNKEIEKAVLSRALNDSELRTRDLIQLGRDYVWETDTDYQFTYVSPQAESIRGAARQTLIQSSLFEDSPAEHSEVIMQTLRDSLKQRKPVSFELVRQTSQGTILREQIHAIALIDSVGSWLGFRGIAYRLD
ncbi:MAG: PAS domain S-box protein [Hahellaceae bacterium]|nr:PAS domain S-box protein [Hahellaceae bacterium]MCP5169333.1 PAS domain S-box protein [Hahellaceae bacterium]